MTNLLGLLHSAVIIISFCRAQNDDSKRYFYHYHPDLFQISQLFGFWYIRLKLAFASYWHHWSHIVQEMFTNNHSIACACFNCFLINNEIFSQCFLYLHFFENSTITIFCTTTDLWFLHNEILEANNLLSKLRWRLQLQESAFHFLLLLR